jgi:DNA polymerase (family X)
VENKRIAEMLEEIAELISVEDFPTARFETRAYKKAALTIATLQEPIEEVYRKGGIPALMELPGVGKSIAAFIEEYLKTGKTKKYDSLKKKYPIDIGALTSIQGLGAKRAVILYKKLGVRNVDDLKKAIEQHKIAKLEGFGEKSEEVLQQGLAFLASGSDRVIISVGLPAAEDLIAKLKKSGLVEKALVAGSARRMRETIGDIDILVISKKQEEVMDFFTTLNEVEKVIAKGPTRSAVRLKMGLNCDIRVLKPESFGAAVQYFTGSRDHNIQVRQIAIDKGYKLNEYGLLDKKGKNVGGVEEEHIYEKLGMQWMPPEMREARGEVKLAQQHRIPRLVELGDIKGDLHTHTKESDGANTLEEMAEAAMKLGWEYINNTDHTKSEPVARGKDDKAFEGILKKVDKLNERLEKEGKKFRVLKGAECDILKDGSLDLQKKTLEQMDCVVGSVHQNTKMEEKEMTQRVIKALDSGLVNVLAHPTGRIVGVREPFKIDLEKVAEAAERNNVAMEINSNQRLDLSDTNIMLVSKYKVMFAIDTDSHRTLEYSLMRYGVGTARRGWVTPDKVINTMNLGKLEKWLER